METPINSTEKKESAREEAGMDEFEKMFASGSSYIDTKIDGLKTYIKEYLFSLFTLLSSIFFGITILLIAISFFIYGIAIGLGEALGGRLWLGFIITGGSLLLGKLIFSKLILFKRRKNREKNTAQNTGLRNWIRKYPFCSTGIVAATGFIFSARVSSPPLKETDPLKTTPKKSSSSFITSLVKLAKDILKESMIPIVKEHLTSIRKE